MAISDDIWYCMDSCGIELRAYNRNLRCMWIKVELTDWFSLMEQVGKVLGWLWIFNVFMDRGCKSKCEDCKKGYVNGIWVAIVDNCQTWRICEWLERDDWSFNSVCTRKGIKVSAEKNIVVMFERKPLCTITLKGIRNEEVRVFAYLGSMMREFQWDK